MLRYGSSPSTRNTSAPGWPRRWSASAPGTIRWWDGCRIWPPRGTFGLWCKNWYGSSPGYTFQMTAIAQRLAPESDISAYTPAIFRNLSDEIADQYSRTPHHVLRYRILERAGTSFDVPRGADDPDMLTESFTLHN